MLRIELTAYDLAQRYVGVHELAGKESNHPLIQWWLSLCGLKEQPDETPWCSAFVNGIAWELRLPRSKAANARSWLNVGVPVALEKAEPGFDVVVFSRGTNPFQGHVGFFSGMRGDFVQVLGGNQSDGVCVEGFEADRVIGVRRLA